MVVCSGIFVTVLDFVIAREWDFASRRLRRDERALVRRSAGNVIVKVARRQQHLAVTAVMLLLAVEHEQWHGLDSFKNFFSSSSLV